MLLVSARTDAGDPNEQFLAHLAEIQPQLPIAGIVARGAPALAPSLFC